ncbi:MAG: hypothetical protein H0V42_07140 [Nocardioidaceae bacterium]|nr:hypothetical protein [Nocardioidaceae bacterium]
MATSSSPPENTPGHPRPVERFKPTSGIFTGYAGVALVLLTVGYVAYTVHTVTGLRIALAAVFFGLIVWVTQLRPRATVYPQHLVLKNSVRDAHVPLDAIDEISLGQTLNVWVGDQRYVCIGIGNSIRAEIKSHRKREQTVGSSRLTELTLRAERANNDERAMSYQTFVETRLEELVDAAKRQRGPKVEVSTVAEPGYRIAWVEVAALVVIALAFLASLLL